MNGGSCNITLMPEERILSTNKDDRLLDSLVSNNILLRTDCGGKGRCSKCLVEIIGSDGSTAEKEACNYWISEDISLNIPEDCFLISSIIDKAPVQLPQSFMAAGASNKKNGNPRFGIGVDLGTTTIAVYLCNLQTREVIGSVAIQNPQNLRKDHGTGACRRHGISEGVCGTNQFSKNSVIVNPG